MSALAGNQGSSLKVCKGIVSWVVAWNSLVRGFEDKKTETGIGDDESVAWGVKTTNRQTKLHTYKINSKTPKTTTVFRMNFCDSFTSWVALDVYLNLICSAGRRWRQEMRDFQRICPKLKSYLSLSGLPLPQVTCSAKVLWVLISARLRARIWRLDRNTEKTLFLSSRVGQSSGDSDC